MYIKLSSDTLYYPNTIVSDDHLLYTVVLIKMWLQYIVLWITYHFLLYGIGYNADHILDSEDFSFTVRPAVRQCSQVNMLAVNLADLQTLRIIQL